MGGSVCVLGLSDIGRSPRLQNHAVSLAKQARVTCCIIVMTKKPLNCVQELANQLYALYDYKAVRLRYAKQHFDWLCQGPRKPLLDCHIVSSCFLQAHFAVDVVGYSGSMPLSALSQDSNIQIHCVPEL